MASGDNSYNNSSNSYIAQPGYWCPSQYASPFPNQSIWQGTLRPETWSKQEALHYLPYSPASCSETSDSSSTASTTKRKRNTWSTAEEEILLNLCGEHKSGLKGSGSSQKWQQHFDGLSHDVNRVNPLRNPFQCGRSKNVTPLFYYNQPLTKLSYLKFLTRFLKNKPS